jgi:hypothetical protein
MRLGNPQNLQPSVPQRIDQRGQDALDRKRLRRASNTIVISSPIDTGRPPVTPLDFENFSTFGWVIPWYITPFRAMMNAADPLGTFNKGPMGPNSYLGDLPPQYSKIISQVSSVRRSSNSGWKGAAGSIRVNPNSGSIWTGNPRFVYDSSDYVTFKRLQAKNRNYKDPTFGGDEHNASQVALARGRR